MILTRTPFRLPLGGGGTDLPAYYTRYGGFLVTASIDKHMYININRPALVNKIKLNYTRTEIVNTASELKHDVVRESLKLMNIGAPIEIHSMADLSGGTGLGSSSTYTVGLLNGLSRIVRKYISVQELAELACKVEIDLIGKPIGKQDQYAAAFGGIIVLKIGTDGKVDVIPLHLHTEVIRDFENHLMMFYTEIERDANEILAEQSRKLGIGGKESEALSVKREAGRESEASSVRGEAEKSEETKRLGEEQIGRQGDFGTGKAGDKGSWGKEGEGLGMNREESGWSKPKRENPAVQAMHDIKEIGYRSKNALENGDHETFGKLMHRHWEIKKKISIKMSNLQIDKWYEIAMNSGAIGGKIMGAGGGGFFLFCVENGKRKHLRSTLERAGLRYMDFRFDFEGSKVIANV